MSVIIKGKNPRKPHTVRHWADAGSVSARSRDPRRRLQEAPRASGGACLPVEPLSCAALHHARCCGESGRSRGHKSELCRGRTGPRGPGWPPGSGCASHHIAKRLSSCSRDW